MAGTDNSAVAPDPEKMTNKEMYEHFNKILVGQAQYTETRFADIADKIEGLEALFATKLNNKFQELLVRLPPVAPAPQPRQQPHLGGHARCERVGAPSAAGAVAHDDDYEGDDEFVD